MSVMQERLLEIFDQKQQVENNPVDAARVVLELGGMAMKFAHIERAPRHDDGRRENDAEHSFNLALVAPELAAALYPTLALGLITQFCIVHDLIELEVGDVATFNISTEDLASKEATEQAAMGRLLHSLPPHLRSLVERYEQQVEAEAIFVRAVDKLLPAAQDINGDGIRVMREDTNIHTLADLQKCQRDVRDRLVKRFGQFPELIMIKDVLDHQFRLKWLTATGMVLFD